MRELKSAILTVVMMMILCILLFLTVGCKTIKKSVSEKEKVSDSVRIEYREKIVKVPVTVEVEVPVEVREKFSSDSTSHLETSFAISDASMVWIDGVAFLRHTLANKPQKIEKTENIPVVEKEKIVYQTRRVTYNRTEIREKQINLFQKALMWVGVIAIFISSIWLVFKLLRR